MEDRVKALEAEIARAETAIAECEAGLQIFVSAEETTRLTQDLATHRSKLQKHLAEWEELAQALEA
jgi:predicted nuclease with TOPRIM domain